MVVTALAVEAANDVLVVLCAMVESEMEASEVVTVDRTVSEATEVVAATVVVPVSTVAAVAKASEINTELRGAYLHCQPLQRRDRYRQEER